ncbi:MAG: HAMP domain-containing protein [Verrucomicrobiaceae bacterium]|nr:MAG: HAMP domain-containing protein [Verrucomicrobiaceae bacterium]
MTRSLRRQLCWWHTALFAAAIAISLILAWRAMPEENESAPQREDATWRYFVHTALESCVPFAVLGAISWWIIHRSLSPVVDLTNAAEHIHEASLHRRLPLRGTGDELDRLTSVLNDMTGRLETSFQRIREFTLHASHELKTPLTILRSGFEQSLARPGLNPALKDQIINWMDEVERLNRIVSGLTLLTRADARQFTLTRETVALHDLVRDAASEAEILGQATHLQVALHLCGPVIISADRHRLRQLLLNLTDNAVKYNRPGGHIAYTLETDGAWVTVTVESGGRGIPPDELPQIFNRFFRSIDYRGTGQEGVGLGLSIAQLIAEAHGGRITAASVPDRTSLCLHLPLEQPPPAGLPVGVPG